VSLKHMPLSWLILEICNVFNRRVSLRYLLVSIALKNVRAFISLSINLYTHKFTVSSCVTAESCVSHRSSPRPGVSIHVHYSCDRP
jgi:hypothetical protein